MKGSIFQKSSLKLNFLLVKPPWANGAFLFHLENHLQTFRNFQMGAWHPKKRYRNSKWINHLQFDKNTFYNCSVCGNKKNTSTFKNFCLGITTRTSLDAVQEMDDFLPQEKKWLAKARIYFANSCDYLSSQVNDCKILILYKSDR